MLIEKYTLINQLNGREKKANKKNKIRNTTKIESEKKSNKKGHKVYCDLVATNTDQNNTT